MEKNKDMVDVLDFETLQDCIVEESSYKTMFDNTKEWLKFNYPAVFIGLGAMSFAILVFVGLNSFVV